MGYIPDDIGSSNRTECDGVTKISLRKKLLAIGEVREYTTNAFWLNVFLYPVDYQNMVDNTCDY